MVKPQLTVGLSLCSVVLPSPLPFFSGSLSLLLLDVSLYFPTLHLSRPSLPDSWQSQPGIRAVQTAASRTQDLQPPLVTWHSENALKELIYNTV